MEAAVKKATGSSEKDRKLIRAFQRGDKTAFDALVRKHKDKVFNLCYRFLGDRQEANDSAQDAFIKVYRSLKKFRLESAFSTWLYRLVANTCKNRLTSLAYRQKKKTIRLSNPGDMEDGQPSMEIRDESPSPINGLEMKERAMLIQEAIGSLPTDKRTVVVLHDIEGLSYEEVSKITGLNMGTVKSRLSRARLALRDKLRGVV